MDIFLEKYNLPKVTQEEIDNSHSPTIHFLKWSKGNGQDLFSSIRRWNLSILNWEFRIKHCNLPINRVYGVLGSMGFSDSAFFLSKLRLLHFFQTLSLDFSTLQWKFVVIILILIMCLLATPIPVEFPLGLQLPHWLYISHFPFHSSFGWMLLSADKYSIMLSCLPASISEY